MGAEKATVKETLLLLKIQSIIYNRLMLNRRISIAPMMGCTDRHFRMFMRQISRHVLLYTEMVTTGALLKGKQWRCLDYSPEEHPLALQVGGSDPQSLALCARLAEEKGFDEINLNVGCPSGSVTAGRFGACLLKEAELVADCVAAMSAEVNIPVSVKTRTGVDDQDSYEHLYHFVKTVAEAGCRIFIIHARKAWLKGLSPAENRTVPPLAYPMVYQLKQDFPGLEIIINGGIKTIEAINDHLREVDGVMIGREAYANPLFCAAFDDLSKPVFSLGVADKKQTPLTPKRVLLRYLPYMAKQLANGVPLYAMTRHLNGLFQGQPGAKKWRRFLHENTRREGPIAAIEEALRLASP
ncbi:tRNA dihydrouridine(20/20a) synthase DusA [Coxiella burnetii]|uniref:tRNA dihydrouridine(20/20a) synthase DusA n=1 Tax=Coxiella burnetii TaxID=777 RepID=UPI00051F18E2|nr:tRNA dihydrouridine(20/20a) synthase DusA [Coxiella burnetii]AIT63048.1 tRNA-dihydrouridine synthase [Coxiella burnetii str. Namibia]